MVTAPVRREVVRAMVTRGLSERRALTVVRMSASSLRYVPAPDQNASLRARIEALAHRPRRYGAGMIYLKLRQAGQVGKWDGDTLVVDTVGFNDQTWLDEGGHPHSDALHVVERFRRRDFGHMEIQITIDDSKAYAKPWTVAMLFDLLPDTELIEHICENLK
jgi:hypothetical protein